MHLTSEEQANGCLTDEHLTLARRTLRDVGYVVLEGVYDRAYITDICAAYNELLDRYIAGRGGMEAINKGKKGGVGRNHIAMFLPFLPPFSEPEIVANPVAVQVMSAVLGEDLSCSFYNSNTAYPGSEHQHIHRDTSLLFGTELQVPTPCTHVVLNIPLTDFTEENGSTEVWPGSHLIVDTTVADGRATALEERAKDLASARTNIPAGSIVVRDLRTWHRGMPNNSQEVRTMLAIVYERGWMRAPRPVDIPRATWQGWSVTARNIFRHNNIVDSVDYIGVAQH